MPLFDFVFPVNCLGCGKSGKYICNLCIGRILSPKNNCPYCQRASVDGVTHVKCQKKYGLDGLVSLWQYQGVIRQALIKLKYKYIREIANELTELVERRTNIDPDILPKKAVMIPVPLYWYKENVRGFNQSAEIGKLISKKIGCEFFPDVLLRKKLKQAQTLLTAKKRKVNIKNVFAFNSKYILRSENYILFDDVYTTGPTLKEAGKVLKRNGARNVWGLTIAR